MRGLYRGYFTTVAREIPFSLIQFPLWEYLKTSLATWRGRQSTAWEASLSGAVAGGLAAGATTPLDVAKTRIMLARVGTREAEAGMVGVMRIVVEERGVRGLFAGVTPRVSWISIGDTSRSSLHQHSQTFTCRRSGLLRGLRAGKIKSGTLFMIDK